MATIYWIIKPGGNTRLRVCNWLNANCNHWFQGRLDWPVDPTIKRDPGYVECYWFDDWQDSSLHTMFKLIHSDVIVDYRLEKPDTLW